MNFNILPLLSLPSSITMISSTPIPSTSKSTVGRPVKPFSNSSNITKNRKIKNLLAENSKEKLIYAAKSVLYSDGNYAGADLLEQCMQFSPKRALKIRKSYKDSLKLVNSHYTVDEALALIIDTKLTKQSYLMIKKVLNKETLIYIHRMIK